MRTLRRSAASEADIRRLLRWSHERFGAEARRRYERLLSQALLDVTADPFRIGSAGRSEFGTAVRSYPLRFSRVRVGGGVGQPRHILYFRVASAELVQLGRVLHDAMDPSRHIAAGDFEA